MSTMIKYGVKLWTRDTALIDEAKKLIEDGMFHYVELIIDPDFLDVAPFDYDLPYVIHSPHENFGVDIGVESRKKHTLNLIKHSLKFADKLDARGMIIHAGTGSEEDAVSTLSEIKDDRIIIENMPVVGLNGERCLGYDANSILSFSKDICLDFVHASKASITLKKDYQEVISEFLEIGPKMFHISDGNFKTETDKHLNIGGGEYDIKYFINCVKNNKSRYVTLETPRKDFNSLEEDVNNLNLLKHI